MSSYRLNIYAFYGVSLAIMVCSFYVLYYFMKDDGERTERAIISISVIGSIVSLICLFMVIKLDRIDQGQLMIPTYTVSIDDLPKPRPIMTGLDTAET